MLEKLKNLKFFKRDRDLKKSTKILLVTNSLILISAWMIAPIYAVYVEKIGWDLMDASIALGLFALAAWIVTLLSWKYVDEAKNKTLIIVVWYLLMASWFFLYTVADSVIFLFAIQVLIWIWEAIYSPAFDALYWSTLRASQKWLGWWIWEFMNYLTMAMWAFTWWLIIKFLGFNAIFISMWLLSLFSACYLYYVSLWNKCELK